MSTIRAGFLGGLVAGLFMTIATPSKGQVVPNGVVPLRPGVGYSVSVWPDGTPASYPANSGPHSLGFTVINTGIYTDTYTLTCSSVGGISCGSVVPSTLQLQPDREDEVTVTFSVGSSGGTLRMTATGVATDLGYYTITAVTPPPPAVAPDGDTVLVFRDTFGLQQQFLVKNVDSTSHSYSLTKSCTGAAVSTCSLSPTSMDLAAGESRPATITYQTNTSTSGIVKVIATQIDQSLAKDSGWVPLRTVASPYPVISVADMNPVTTVERGLCLTIAAGPAGAAECGDLRIVHPLPAIRTLNKTRVPTLMYNSAHAAPYPVVAANVTVTSQPTTGVEAILKIGGVQRASGQWAGSDWAANSTRRIALGFDASSLYATGIYDYTLEVATLYPTRYATTVSGKLIIVNRSSSTYSPFGIGWWLAGLERVYVTGSDRLWVGGDGSARRYAAAGTNTWVAANPSRPDTLKLISGYYERRLPGGVVIKFNTSGYHVQTVNPLNHVTTFSYDGSNRLSTITLPAQGGSQTYVFAYTGSWLDSIRAPSLPTQTRNVKVTQASGKVTQIRDPDNTTVGFGYSGNRIVSRTDRRSTTTEYGYDAAAKLWRVNTTLSASDSIRIGLHDQARRGFFNQSPNTAIDPASVYTILYGARTYATGGDYINQQTWFYLDRFGAPWQVRDAAGQWTSLFRGDAQYPALATRVHYANGRTLGAGYDRRGNVLFSTDSTHSNATTHYAWDTKWDRPTRIVPPAGDSTVVAYDASTGNPLWQQDARGSVSRTTFTYWSSGSKLGLLWKVNPPLTPSGDYEYNYGGPSTNLVSAQTPMGILTRFASDTLGRDTLAVAPIGNGGDSTRTRTVYDLMDRVVRTETHGPAVTYNFSSYFAGGAPAEITVVVNGYDAEGNLDTNQRYVDRDGMWQSYMQTTYTYDRANRPVTVSRPQVWYQGGLAVDSTVYDAAGNPTRKVTPRGHSITMQYDVMNRLLMKVVPQVDYAQTGCAEHGLNFSPPVSCDWVFPIFPNNGGGLRITADTSTFTYDAVGNVLTANNRYARVKRTLNLDGSVATDSLRLRDYSGSSFNTHVYGVRYHYDLGGRRDSLYHPGNLAPQGTLPQSYLYGVQGQLSEVRNGFGNRYRFYYDAAGRLDSLAVPSGWETYGYDDDGHKVARVERAGSTTLHDDDLTYDQAGRIHTASGIGGFGWQVENVYTGSGQLLATDMARNTGLPHWIQEYQTDGLSNIGLKRADEGVTEPEFAYEYDDFSGLLERIVALQPPNAPPEWTPDTTYSLYDEAGNVRHKGWRHFDLGEGGIPGDDYWAMEAGTSYYGADAKLMAYQVYRDSLRFSLGTRTVRRGMWEEYWYDALGRRVLVRRRGGDATALCFQSDYCLSSIERYVWDGDQILWELRAPGGTYDPLDDTPPYGGDYKQFGRVGYTQGPGLDSPLDLARLDYNGTTRMVLPRKNWRGAYDAGTDTTGTVLSEWDIQFPASYRDAFHSDPDEPFRDRREWFGSLIQDKADESGLIYMRNRYYDPATGRFTQEDPIGLAGGLNLYGFANGDPVNFGDPFGLCKTKEGKDRPCRVEISPEGEVMGADLDDLTPETREWLQRLADKADVDLGINSTTNGSHLDPGHAAGTAVDIGYVNGNDIGYRDVTFEGMEALSLHVQSIAAEMGGLKDTGNLGPAGKFIGPVGPLPINSPSIRDAHMNHIHISRLVVP
jgi:RHS repeat-associated protein